MLEEGKEGKLKVTGGGGLGSAWEGEKETGRGESMGAARKREKVVWGVRYRGE